MSNALNARRVMIQNLDKNGRLIGSPFFGVIVSDSYASAYNDTFDSFDQLNNEIEQVGCIAHLCEEFKREVDPAKVGIDNFYGNNWAKE